MCLFRRTYLIYERHANTVGFGHSHVIILLVGCPPPLLGDALKPPFVRVDVSVQCQVALPAGYVAQIAGVAGHLV